MYPSVYLQSRHFDITTNDPCYNILLWTVFCLIGERHSKGEFHVFVKELKPFNHDFLILAAKWKHFIILANLTWRHFCYCMLSCYFCIYVIIIYNFFRHGVNSTMEKKIRKINNCVLSWRACANLENFWSRLWL